MSSQIFLLKREPFVFTRKPCEVLESDVCVGFESLMLSSIADIIKYSLYEKTVKCLDKPQGR